MKRRLKRLFFKSIKMALSLLMVFTTINLAGIQNVSAADLLPEATMSYSGTTGIQVDLSSAGVNKTGYIYNMNLNNGQAFCLDAGYHARKGQYARTTTVTGSIRNRIWNYCLNDESFNHYFNGTPGSWSNGTRAVAQGMLWAYEEGVGEDNAAEIICKVWAEVDPGTLTTAGEYAKGVAKSWWNAMKSYSSSGTLYIYSYGKSDNQRLITSKPGVKPVILYDEVNSNKTYSITENVLLAINKTDVDTNNGLEGTIFDLYRDNVKVTTVTTDGNGKASYTFSNTFVKSASSSKEYISNYGTLSISNQQIADQSGAYISKSDAQAAADAEALAKAKAEVEALTGQNHHYVAIEVGTRNYYYLEPNVTLSKDVAGNGDINFDLTNEVQRGSITLNKVDKNLNNHSDDRNIFDANNDGAEGDATISGATYGLYAAETINHPDGKSGIVTYNSTGGINQIILTKGTNFDVKNVAANAGTLLATAKTDENGELQFDHLYAGKYYIKEIESSEGYLLDETQYDIDLTASNDVKVITKNATSQEQVKKQAFDLYKAGHVPGTSTNAKPLAGVEFTVKLESDVQRMGWDNAPVYDVLTTDENGQASSIELPYGTYRVRETKPAVDYNTAEDFFVTISEDSRIHQSFTNNVIIDETFQAMIKAVKLDKETGKQVQLPNAEFKIKALTDCYVDGKKFNAGEYIGYWNWNIFDGFYTDSWKTNDQGYVLINEKLSAGEYQLEEIHAPYGYVLDDEPIQFTVTNQNMYELADDGKTPIITVVKSDVSVKGQITVYKKGEVLTDFVDGQFIYEERYLPGMKVGIYAKEDILDPSNDGTILYAKDTLIETLTTDDNGKAISSKLPLGQYYSKEIEAPNGYILNDEIKTFTLEYANENVELVFDEDTYTNDRQTVRVYVSKQDSDNLEYLKGMEASIFANRDIYNYDGEVIVNAGTKLQTVTTGENGTALFMLDLPNDLTPAYATMPIDDVDDDLDSGFSNNVIDGVKLVGNPNSLFVVKETKAPDGYVPIEMNVYIDTTYTNQNQSVLEFEAAFQNDITVTEISKVDATNGEQLSNAHLQIIDPETNEVVEETVTTDEVWVVKGLIYGKEYVLRETLAPKGYAISNEVTFTVGANEKVEMKDELLTKFSKQNVGGEEIEGATIVVKDEEGNVVDQWTSTKNPHEIVGLENGKTYTMHEEVAANGYIKANDIKFVAGAENNHITMIDKQVIVSKIDQTNKFVSGAKMQVLDATTKAVVEEWITDGKVHPLNNVELGKTYILHEVEAPDNYILAEDIEFTVNDNKENQIITMVDTRLDKVAISKKDVTTKDELIGAKMKITDMDGNVIEEWISAKDPHYVWLAVGKKYKLIEEIAPKNYSIAEAIIFEIDDNGNIVQQVVMYDELLPVKKITKTGDDTTVGSFAGLGMIALSGIAILSSKKRKRLKK